MQISNRSDLDCIRRTYSAQVELSKLAQQKEKESKVDPTLAKHFHESREHYKALLDKAEPIPADVLTVSRINSLQSKNKALISFLSELYVSMQKDFNVKQENLLARYLEKMNSFVENYKKL